MQIKKFSDYKGTNGGFTLLELLISISIFAVVALSVGGFFLMSAKGQRNTIDRQNLVDNIRFGTEFMARQIRLAEQDSSGGCTGEADHMFTSSASTISFVSFDGDCITYRLNSGKIQISPDFSEPFSDITSGDITVNNLEFTVEGEDLSDGEQPRVTIIIEAETAGSRPGEELAIEFQTTVSARNVDIQ